MLAPTEIEHFSMVLGLRTNLSNLTTNALSNRVSKKIFLDGNENKQVNISIYNLFVKFLRLKDIFNRSHLIYKKIFF